MSIWDLNLFFINTLKFESDQSMKLAWYIIENHDENNIDAVMFDEDRELDKKQMLKTISKLVTMDRKEKLYRVFTDKEKS